MPDKPAELSVKRTSEFVNRYANNCRFENYGTDLKILFGQSDQESGGEVIEQHTAITLAWPQVKLLIYYLELNLTAYESDHGPVNIHPVLIPAPFPESNDPRVSDQARKMRELREKLLTSLKR